MSVQERRLKSGKIAFYAVWQGTWQRCETKAEAIATEAAMKGGVEAPISKVATVATFGDRWLAARANRTADKDRSMLERHVFSRAWLSGLRVSDVRPRHIIQLVSELRGSLSDKSISNVLGTLRVLFRDAIIQEIAFVQPVILPKEHLKRRRAVEPEIYQPAECIALMTNRNLDPRARMLFALLLCTGLRQGEAVGRNWEDFSDTAPLACMRVATQYDGAPLKTENPRQVPVHPLLAEALRWWASEGYPAVYGKAPAGGPIVPSESGSAMTKNTSYKLLRTEAARIGVEWRGVHATRHTFITLTRRGGADKVALEKVTHNARGDIVDGYTRSDWEPLCLAVSCLRFDSDQRLALPSGNPGKNPFLPQSTEADFPSGNTLMNTSLAGFDSPRLHQRKRPEEPRQRNRSIGDLSGFSGRFQVGPDDRVPAILTNLLAAAHRLGVLPANRQELEARHG